MENTMLQDAVKMAIIGSGAIAEESYLPAAAALESVQITHMVDLDIQRAKAVAERFGIPKYTDDYREIFNQVEAAVVATPPAGHKEISIHCMENGIDVLCEKPLANTFQEAEEMVAAAKRNERILAVGMVRRVNWSARTMKKLIEYKILGRVLSFEVVEGWEFNWPLRTNHIFQSRDSRGVISDTGAHMLDLIVWLLGMKTAKIDRCTDDNWGGTEANAEIRLSGIDRCQNEVHGTLELSFTRRLKNTVKIIGENGSLEASTVGDRKILYQPTNPDDNPLVFGPEEELSKVKNDEFVSQLSIFIDSVKGLGRNHVDADTLLTSIALIDECYRMRKPQARPWEKLHIESYFEGGING